MKRTLLLTALICILGSWAAGSISLSIDGQSYDAFPLKVGQEVLIEIRSSTIMPYSAYAGFDEGTDPLGTVSNPERFPLSSGASSIEPVFSPPLYGYHVQTGSMVFTTGLHFRFTYTAQTPGQTLLKLYNHDMSVVRDSLILTVEPAQTGTGFTYQGRLLDENAGANGPYDFMFLLYDAPSEGVRVANENFLEDVEVLDGYFTVTLDFGDAFGDEARWLETSVRPGESTGDYTVLSPRQRITPAPAATYAARAGYAEAVDWANIADVPAGIASYVAPAVDAGYLPYYDGSQLVNSPLRTDGQRSAVGADVHTHRALNVTTPSEGTAVHGETTRNAGINIGVHGVASGNSPDDKYGVMGVSSNSSGSNYAIRGVAMTASTGTNYAVYGYAVNSGSGNAYAGYFNGDVRTTGLTSIGTDINSGRKLNVYTDSTVYGIYSNNARNSGSNAAVYGTITGNTSGLSFGVYGESGSGSGENYGLYGRANTPSTGTNFGVYGYAFNSGAGSAVAGYFDGRTVLMGDVAIGTTSVPSGRTIHTITGAYLSTGGSWVNSSSRDQKENFAPVDGRSVLEKLAGVPISTWNYKAEDPSIRHIGPISQDLYEAFGLNGNDETISTIDASGLSFAAIQGLYEILEDKNAEIASVRQENESIRREHDLIQSRLAVLEARLAELSDAKGGLQ